MHSSANSRSHSESNSLKRLREEDSESDSETVTDTWPRFLVITSKNTDQTFDKLSPFFVAKALKGIIGEAKDAKILRSGTVLVECARKQQSVNLRKCKMLGNIPVDVSPHSSLNFCKGVIRSRDLRNATEQEMLEDMRDQHVTEVKRVIVTRNGEKTPTNTFILKFDVPTLPSSVKAAFTVCPVEPYVPNPLRCFNCQRFGHHKDKCGREIVCGRCGQVGHDLSSCKNPLQCPNCKGDHFAYSKECAKWKQEKEIQAVKVKHNITFKEARKQVESRTPGGLSAPSYAAVTRTAPDKTECTTCKILLEKICYLFPEKANEIRQILETSVNQHNLQEKNNTADLPKPTVTPVKTPSNQNPPPSTASLQKSPKNGKALKEKEKSSKTGSTHSNVVTKSPKQSKPSSAQSNELLVKEKQRPKLHRLTSNGDSPGVVLKEVCSDQNKFSALEHMEDTDEPHSDWEKPPSWTDDPISWDNANVA